MVRRYELNEKEPPHETDSKRNHLLSDPKSYPEIYKDNTLSLDCCPQMAARLRNNKVS